MNIIMWIVSGLYAFQSGVYLANAKPALALVLASYAIANLGLIWSAQ
jgi:hypothetical protein